MQIKHTLFAAALATPAFVSPALAEERPIEVGGFLGWHIFSGTNELGSDDGDSSRTPADSLIFGVRLGTPITKAIGVEGELGLIPTESKADSRDDTLVLAWRGNALYHVDVTERARLFGLVGLGATSQATSDLGGLTADTDFVAHAGVGAKIHVRDDWGVRLDARLLLPPTTDGGGVTTDVELTIGLARVFRGEPAAPAPAPAEPPPPPPPGEDPDPDGDGVQGGADGAPLDPEDRDGFQDDDGVPDLDNDGDKVLDADDRCPLEAETVNSFEDGDGCPDEVPAAIKQFTGAIEGVVFANNSDRLIGRSGKTLDAAAKVLAEYPSLRLEIQGHTDDTGDRAYNLDLSQRRADAVRTYLVGKGIAADRLEAKGYGPDRPAVTGTTAAARAKNRRVELSVLSR